MRITHIVWGMPQGGLESMLVDICNVQSETDDVQIVVVNDDIDMAVIRDLDPRVLISRVGRPRGSRNPWFLLKVNFLIRRFRSEVVHAHQAGLAFLLKFAGVPSVLTVHDTIFGGGSTLSTFNRVCAISNSVKRTVEAANPKLSCDLVANGVVSARISSSRHRASDSNFRIVQVSRLELPKKGQDLAIEAILGIQDQKLGASVQLDLIGEGPAKHELEALVEQRNLRNRVHFVGKLTREEVYRRLPDYDLLIQPSRYEGFGLTVVEAMIARVPVLVSDIDGPAEIVGHGKYGDMFKSESVADFSRMLTIAIQNRDGYCRKQRTEMARLRAIERYDVETTAREYRGIYEAEISRTKVR